MRTTRFLPAILAAGVVLAGCSGAVDELVERGVEEAIVRGIEAEGGGEVDLDFDTDGEGSISFESSEGTVSIGAGGDVPASFPDTLAVPEGGNVLQSAEISGDAPGFRLLIAYEGASYEDIAAQIRASVEENFEVTSDTTGTMGEGSATTLAFEGDWQGVVQVLDDGEDTVTVSYTLSAAQ